MPGNLSGPAGTGRGAIVGVLAATGNVVSATLTLIIPVAPRLPLLLRTSQASASWAITATLLAGAVFTPVAGRLGDMFGKRRMLLLCLCLLVTGSLACAFSNTLAPMIAGRALQGCAVAISCVIGAGIGLAYGGLPTLIMAAVPERETAAANGVTTASR